MSTEPCPKAKKHNTLSGKKVYTCDIVCVYCHGCARVVDCPDCNGCGLRVGGHRCQTCQCTGKVPASSIVEAAAV
jgi:hypothetical protein